MESTETIIILWNLRPSTKIKVEDAQGFILGDPRWCYSERASAVLLKHFELLIPSAAVYLYGDMVNMKQDSRTFFFFLFF